MAEYVIYMHKNKINNKVYIGQTSQELNKRWKNGLGYIDSPKFYKAILKYGWDNFEHIILEKNIEDVNLADERERYWIEYYNSIQEGYNISLGGSKHPRGEEFGQRISQGQKENWNNNPERREKAKAHMQNQWKNEEYRKNFLKGNNGNASKIICVELNKIFNSIIEAAEWANTSRQNISGVCQGRQKTAGGFHWKYYNKESEN